MAKPKDVTRPKGLTDEEAAFVHLIVTGAAKTSTDAALQVGKTPETARMWGWRAAHRARVKAYMGMVRAAAAEQANALATVGPTRPVVEVMASSQVAVADSAEVMRALTGMLRSDIGDIFVKDEKTGVVSISLAKAMEKGVTHLIDEVSITDKGIRVKFPKKLEVINTLVRVLGMEDASEADKVKERTAMAEVLSKLPPEVLEQMNAAALGPRRAHSGGNGNGNGTH